MQAILERRKFNMAKDPKKSPERQKLPMAMEQSSIAIRKRSGWDR